MITPKDFRVSVGQSDKGVFVRVVHEPTGNVLAVDPVGEEPVGGAVQRLISELTGRVFNPADFVTHHIRARPTGFMRVVHLPSGKHRDSDGKRTLRELQDELLNEIAAEELAPEKE